jgi:hypothetical protein
MYCFVAYGSKVVDVEMILKNASYGLLYGKLKQSEWLT